MIEQPFLVFISEAASSLRQVELIQTVKQIYFKQVIIAENLPLLKTYFNPYII